MSWPKWFQRQNVRVVGAPHMGGWKEVDNVPKSVIGKSLLGLVEQDDMFKQVDVKRVLYPNSTGLGPGGFFLPIVDGGSKHDEKKPPMELLPPLALEAEARVLAHGRNKYHAFNWAQGIPPGRLLGAALRHIFQYLRGENTDPESGESHLAHAACMVHFALEQQLRPGQYAQLDDRHTWLPRKES